MKLYTVTLTFQYVVAASNSKHAEELAEKYAADAWGDSRWKDMTTTIEEYQSALGWDDDCFPYGWYGGDLTIKDYLEE